MNRNLISDTSLLESLAKTIRVNKLSLETTSFKNPPEAFKAEEEQLQILELKPVSIVCIKPSGLECRLYL